MGNEELNDDDLDDDFLDQVAGGLASSEQQQVLDYQNRAPNGMAISKAEIIKHVNTTLAGKKPKLIQEVAEDEDDMFDMDLDNLSEF